MASCPECKRALGHRPSDCHLDVSRGGEIVGPCECRCRTGEVSLDASGFYWPYHDQRRARENRPLPVFRQYGSMLLEVDQAEVRRRAAVAHQGEPTQRERPAARQRKPVVEPAPPPAPAPIVTVPTRREQLIAENLAEMRKRRR